MIRGEEIFVDDMMNIHFIGDSIRLDFDSEDFLEHQTQKSAFGGIRVIMSIDGFLKAFEMMRRLNDQMTQSPELTKIGRVSPAERTA